MLGRGHGFRVYYSISYAKGLALVIINPNKDGLALVIISLNDGGETSVPASPLMKAWPLCLSVLLTDVWPLCLLVPGEKAWHLFLQVAMVQ